MKKTIALSAVLAALTAGTALAASHAPGQSPGPQSIAGAKVAGEGIVMGTGMEVDRKGFVLADARGRIEHGDRKAGRTAREEGSSTERGDGRHRKHGEMHRDRGGDHGADRHGHHEPGQQRPQRQ